MSLVPGLGQVYVGYYRQGFVNILIIASLITLLSRDGLEGFKPLAAIFMVFFWLYNLVDAARKATLYNQSLIGLGAAELPEDIQKPKGRDTLIGGSFLILLGLILLLHTRFGFSLEWVERWWPIALVVAGAYLVSTAYMDRNK